MPDQARKKDTSDTRGTPHPRATHLDPQMAANSGAAKTSSVVPAAAEAAARLGSAPLRTSSSRASNCAPTNPCTSCEAPTSCVCASSAAAIRLPRLALTVLELACCFQKLTRASCLGVQILNGCEVTRLQHATRVTPGLNVQRAACRVRTWTGRWVAFLSRPCHLPHGLAVWCWLGVALDAGTRCARRPAGDSVAVCNTSADAEFRACV